MARVKNAMLNGSNMPKMPSRRDIEAMARKRQEEIERLREDMHIPERDETRYPMPDEADVKNAGAFIYTLGLLAESYDGNLQALVWRYYVELMRALRKDSTHEELISLISALTDLKAYLATSGNPLFTDSVPAPSRT